MEIKINKQPIAPAPERNIHERAANAESVEGEQKGSMELANVWLKINDLGSNIELKRISPAEAIILRADFGVTVEGDSKPITPFQHISLIEGGVNRTKAADLQRLTMKYGKDKVKKAFPGENPNIPLTFKEVDITAENEEPTPKVGKLHNPPLELAKLPKEEVSDEESATEIAAKLRQQGQINDLVQQNKELQSTVKLLIEKLTPSSGPKFEPAVVAPVASTK